MAQAEWGVGGWLGGAAGRLWLWIIVLAKPVLIRLEEVDGTGQVLVPEGRNAQHRVLEARHGTRVYQRSSRDGPLPTGPRDTSQL